MLRVNQVRRCHNLLDWGEQLFAYPTELKVKRLAVKKLLTEAEYQSFVLVSRIIKSAPRLHRRIGCPETMRNQNQANVVQKDWFDRTTYDSL